MKVTNFMSEIVTVYPMLRHRVMSPRRVHDARPMILLLDTPEHQYLQRTDYLEVIYRRMKLIGENSAPNNLEFILLRCQCTSEGKGWWWRSVYNPSLIEQLVTPIFSEVAESPCPGTSLEPSRRIMESVQEMVGCC